MAIFGTSFQIGRSALQAYQTALAVSGQNIANLGNADYARQSARLAAMHGGLTLGGIAPGTGVLVTGLERHVDAAVEARLRAALGSRSGSTTLHTQLGRIEGLYNELTDTDLSTQLSQFFGSFADLQTDPNEPAARSRVLASADALLRTLQRQRSGLVDQYGDLNLSLQETVRQADGLARQIAELNGQIVIQEAGANGGAGALRDRRDAALRQLAELMDIQSREQPNGVVNVYIASEPLVDGTRARGLTTSPDVADGLRRLTVRFADTNNPVRLRDGTLAALVQARDTHVRGQIDQLDRLARGLIYEVNRVHSNGQGLIGYTTLTSRYPVVAANAPLNSAAAGLPFPVENGTFLVQLRDRATGQVTTHQVEVDLDGLNGDDTTLASLAQTLDDLPGLVARTTVDGRLELKADGGYELSFAEDSSGVLAALGLAGFFEGDSAATIAVQDAVRSDARLIAASLSGAPGDGANAGRLGSVGAIASRLLDGRSVLDFHGLMTDELAVATAAAETGSEAADAVYSSLLSQREALSGVNLDEEALNLTKFERSFQGAARYLTVLDSLSGELLSLVR